MSSGKQLILGLTLIPLSVSYGYVLSSLVNEYSVLLLVGIEYVYGMCVCVSVIFSEWLCGLLLL